MLDLAIAPKDVRLSTKAFDDIGLQRSQVAPGWDEVMMRCSAALLLALSLATPTLAASHWQPPAGTSFSIILSASPATVTTPAEVVDLDLFETSKATVTTLKQQGKHVICYMSAGSWENWRKDAKDFPKSVIGKPLDGWPGERYLDIRNLAVLGPIMKARLDLCKSKGFDAVDPDNVDSFETKTGFPLTKADAVTYLRFLATAAHQRGIGIGLKNATEIAPSLLDTVDFAVTEDCFKQGWCKVSRNFVAKDKPVFAIEYIDNNIDFSAFCAQADKLGLSPIYKKRSLNVWERRCP